MDCKYCNSKFVPERPSQVFCCSTCREAYKCDCKNGRWCSDCSKPIVNCDCYNMFNITIDDYRE